MCCAGRVHKHASDAVLAHAASNRVCLPCQAVATSVPDSLYYVAVFLGGEWGKTDFTWPGRVLTLFLCIAGIAIYAVPVGTLFDSFGEVLESGLDALADDDDDDDDDDE